MITPGDRRGDTPGTPLRTYSFDEIVQHAPTTAADLVPDDDASARELGRALAFEATLFGMPAVLQYAQCCEQTTVSADGSWHGVNTFHHERRTAGPDFDAFRVPNVDTLYSNAWLHLSGGAVRVHLPDFGERYYTLNLLDLHGNATNISTRTHGRGPGDHVLALPEWPGDEPGRFAVASPLMWGLLRVQLLGSDDAAAVAELQDAVSVSPLDGASSGFGAGLPRVSATQVEVEWSSFATALDAALRVGGVAREEIGQVARLGSIGIGTAEPFDAAAAPPALDEGCRAGFEAAMALVRANQHQLGSPIASGWTRVENKGRHGHNVTARAVMNFVGLGANVVEENTSFNTRVDAEGRALDGSRAGYRLVLDPPPPVDSFWSLTLYSARTGRVVANELDRYAVGSTTPGVAAAGTGEPVHVAIQRSDPGPGPVWLPAPEEEFFLVLRAYGPRREMLDHVWTPPALDADVAP